jgi:hypothetical protein
MGGVRGEARFPPIEVLFFITGFKKHCVLSNQAEKKSPEFLEKLGKENLDGWLASIENRSHVEVAIMNDPAIFRSDFI